MVGGELPNRAWQGNRGRQLWSFLQSGKRFGSGQLVPDAGSTNLRFQYRGQMFLGIVKDNKLARIIGEETSTPACFPGEQYRFNLPNSRLRVMTSVKYWVSPGGCKGGKGVVPDVVVKKSLGDYLTGRNRILETSLSLIKRKR